MQLILYLFELYTAGLILSGALFTALYGSHHDTGPGGQAGWSTPGPLGVVHRADLAPSGSHTRLLQRWSILQRQNRSGQWHVKSGLVNEKDFVGDLVA